MLASFARTYSYFIPLRRLGMCSFCDTYKSFCLGARISLPPTCRISRAHVHCLLFYRMSVGIETIEATYCGINGALCATVRSRKFLYIYLSAQGYLRRTKDLLFPLCVRVVYEIR